MNAPEKIYGWLNGQLSIARHYGGCTFNGHEFQIDYADPDAPLVRLDIFKAETKAKSEAKKAERMANKERQGALI
jgi:hypothetical protein